MLLGLYIGLIKIIGCSASQFHSWWENGELLLNIKKAHDDRGLTSGYYSWFLKMNICCRGCINSAFISIPYELRYQSAMIDMRMR